MSGHGSSNSDTDESHQNPPRHEIRACPNCQVPVDLILESSDGIRFAAHSQALEIYSEGFPPASLISDGVPVVAVPENSDVVPLLLQYMHPKPQPDLSTLRFGVLEALANAVEKYQIYSAMPVCNMSMMVNVDSSPIAVLCYAAKHKYTTLANKAAVLSIEYEFEAVKEKCEKGSLIPYFWLEYRERYMTVLRFLCANDPPAVLHKGQFEDCALWREFHGAVLKKVASHLVRLTQFEEIVNKTIDEQPEDCSYCIHRARKWGSTVSTKVKNIPPFSTFLS